MTRRYETSWLNADGEAEQTTRLAPAIPQFEEAFSAFARGTVIATTDGSIAVEDLVPGMTAMTVEDRQETIVWIGSMTIYPPRAVPDAPTTALTRITADALGLGRPAPDLVLGPRARLLLRDSRCRAVAGVDAAYAPTRAFIDGEGVIAVTPVAPVTVYHLALRRQGTLRAAGLDIESYHPGAGFAELIDPQLASLFLVLFPHVRSFAGFGPVAYPRLTMSEMERILTR
jgi:hypothetical protein